MKPRHELPVRVYYEDTDAGGIVYHGNFVRYLERARTDMLRDAGFAHQRIMAEFGVQFVVVDISLKFLKPARLDDLLTSTATLVELSRVRMHFDQTIERSGELLVRAQVTAACVALDRHRPVALPPKLVEHFQETL